MPSSVFKRARVCTYCCARNQDPYVANFEQEESEKEKMSERRERRREFVYFM